MGGEEEKKRSFISRLTDSLSEETDKGSDSDEAGGMAKGATDMPGTQNASAGRLALDIDQLREAIRGEIEKSGEELKKFVELLESFRDIIPEEDKRYHAAMEALSKSLGVGKEDIISAADRQLSELESQKKLFALSLTQRRAEMKVLLTKSDRIKGEISRLREEIRRLEEEEKRILDGGKDEDRALEKAEENFDTVVKGLEKEIGETRSRITGYLLEGAPREESIMYTDTGADAAMNTPGEESAGFGGTTREPEAREASGNTKTCPNCRNQMDWYDFDRKWKCFVCAHEEG